MNFGPFTLVKAPHFAFFPRKHTIHDCDYSVCRDISYIHWLNRTLMWTTRSLRKETHQGGKPWK